ncbi:hypothetical protein N0V90_008567 [Kalmusia sp. IMI 367209]|nr:hypothetical protein N0V90_008567 [Kalmusia sp. IMI 367209]
MSANGNGESLFSRLRKAQVGCFLNGEQKFLPLDVLDKEICEDNVRGALSKDSVLTQTLKLFPFTPVDQFPRQVVAQAKKVFAILVNIGEPNAIRKLLVEGLTDDHLPLCLDKDGVTLNSRSGKTFHSFETSMMEQRRSDFVDRQWTVLAPILDVSGRHTILDRRCPLPFEHTEQAGHGVSSTVYKSKLHPAHCSGVKSLEFVATKEFWDEKSFLKENENLKTLASLNHHRLIKHLSTYTRDTTHYVVFPWADGGSLRDFWLRENERVRDRELTMWSLQQMLGIVEAIEALHGVNCRHGDLKPENILHFSGANGGSLIVADVGVSRSHDKATQLRHMGTTTRATTPSYEAPEAFTNHSTPRARRYDVWSLGCIFLEFALWILHDIETINSFGYARHSPNFEFYLLNRDSSEAKRTPEIHPMVTKALALLRKDARCSGGTIFQSFLDLIENRLLRVKVEFRAEAKDLAQELRLIVQNAEANPMRLLNDVTPPLNKLRFLPRAQTGSFEPANGAISEHPVV